jgi:ABC-type glucose/galactose transport system permease subunit
MKIFYILLIIFLSSLIGTALGELITQFLPETGRAYQILSSSITPSWNIDRLDLIVFCVRLGISFKFSILTLAGMITGCLFSLRKA